MSTASGMNGSFTSAIRFCQVLVRLTPSKPTEPSITAITASEPGTGSRPASPVNGQRKRSRPSTTVSGAIRAR